jgi:hypothetical protein
MKRSVPAANLTVSGTCTTVDAHTALSGCRPARG